MSTGYLIHSLPAFPSLSTNYAKRQGWGLKTGPRLWASTAHSLEHFALAFAYCGRKLPFHVCGHTC